MKKYDLHKAKKVLSQFMNQGIFVLDESDLLDCLSVCEFKAAEQAAAPDVATEGYQPTHSTLDPSNPPRGGSGVPPCR